MSLARKRQPSDFSMDDLLSLSALQEEMGRRNRSSSYRYEYAVSSVKRALRALFSGSFSFAKLGRKLFAKSVDKAIEAKDKTVDIANEVFFEDANIPEKPLGKALYFTEGSLRVAKRSSAYWAPVFAALVLVGMVAYMNTFTLGVQVSLDGDIIGYVNTQDQYEMAEKDLENDVTGITGERYSTGEVRTYNVAMVKKDQILSDKEVYDALYARTDDIIGESYGLYVDGGLVAASEQKEALDQVLGQILQPYQEANPDADIGFVEKVEIKDGVHPKSMLMDQDGVYTTLTSVSNSQQVYIVQKDETLVDIAQKMQMTEDEIQALNPDVKPALLREGKKLVVNDEEPFVNVEVVKREQYNEEIAYETEEVETDKMYEGDSRIETEGEPGESLVTAEVTYINGKETSRNVISTQVTKEPVTQVMYIGTKEYPTYSSAGAGVHGDGISYGIFAWPTNGVITSQYAPRWGSFHGALDIANSEGTPVCAADGGVVTVSEWHYSYGNYIMIDHGNGFETLYGHNSVLIANVGDKVSRGQTIALMGSTGNSTGPHCHFEVRINGTRVDPELYLS